MRYLLVLTVILQSCLFTASLCAQNNLGLGNYTMLPFCKPGLSNDSRSRGIDIAFNLVHGGEWDETGGELESLQSVIVKLKVPVINRPGFKMMVGYDFNPESYHFSSDPDDFQVSAIAVPYAQHDLLQGIDSRRLKSNGFGVYLLKPLDHKRYTALRFKAQFNGDYAGWANFNNRYAAYQVSALYGIKKNEDQEWGFGINFSHNFRRTLALPFLLYNRNFNKSWGLEAVFPANVHVRHNVSAQTILLGGYEFQSRNYSIDLSSTVSGQSNIYHLNHSEFLLGLSLEQQLMPWIWLNVKGGYQLNFNTRFEATAHFDPSYALRPPDSFFLRMGFFLSPPDRYFN